MTQTGPTGTLTLQTIAMPADTNASGDIFGGWLMAQMDLGSSVLARGRAKGRVATVAVEAMTFHKPVHVGDIVSIYATMTREGTTLDGHRRRGLDPQVAIGRDPEGDGSEFRLCCGRRDGNKKGAPGSGCHELIARVDAGAEPMDS